MANEVPYLQTIDMTMHKIINLKEAVNDYDATPLLQATKVRILGSDSEDYLYNKLKAGDGIAFAITNNDEIEISSYSANTSKFNANNFVNGVIASYEQSDIPNEKSICEVAIPPNQWADGEVWTFYLQAQISTHHNEGDWTFLMNAYINGQNVGMIRPYLNPHRITSQVARFNFQLQRKGNQIALRNGRDSLTWLMEDTYTGIIIDGKQEYVYTPTINFSNANLWGLRVTASDITKFNHIRPIHCFAYKSHIKDANGFIIKVAEVEK